MLIEKGLQPAFIALLAMLVLGVAWTAIVVTRLSNDINPIANSPIARALSGLGSS